MRTALTIGAVVCCIFGLINGYDVINVIMFHWKHADLLIYLHYPDTYIFSFYTFTSFIPMIVLFTSKRLENPRFRFVVSGIIEIVVISLYLAELLFPPG